MKPRILVLPFAAAVITALCGYKLSRPPDAPSAVFSGSTTWLPAPLFELSDQNSKLFKLASRRGRHEIVLAFFDGETGADRDANLLRLRDRFAELEARGVVVLGVTTVVPQFNRAAAARAGGFPFPLLTDLPAAHAGGDLVPPVHSLYNCYDHTAGQPRGGVIFIDRAGRVETSDGRPRVAASAEPVLQQLLGET